MIKPALKYPKTPFERLLPLITAAGALLAAALTLSFLRKITAVAEWFVRNVSRYIVPTVGNLTSIVPFSVLELLVITASGAGIGFAAVEIVLLCKKRFYRSVKRACVLAVVILSVINLYSLCAGFAYYRAPLVLDRSDAVYKGGDITAVAEYFLTDFNNLSDKIERNENGDAIPPYSHKELAALLREEFKRLDGGYYFEYTPRVKRVANGWFMSDTGITGVAFLPLGEANVNPMTPPSALPQVMAHELAHTKGVMRENEANLVSYYILLTSKNDYLRYCGYFSCFYTLRTAVAIGNNNDWNAANGFFDNVAPEILTEWGNETAFWRTHKGPVKFLSDFLAKAGEKLNDLYLKLNGAKDGAASYQNPSDIIEIPQTDPDTGKTVIKIEPVYSEIHKIFFKIYENAGGQAAPAGATKNA
ncbi:MAG: DUF3810 domain-containing protein [Clostridiales bacterium]|jgi:hypothetical protein|nr:DUF3810 domain-containing protein [Clostridiales bacterium]